MLGLTELDDIICERLGNRDLARCAQVSKKWHSVVIPHLWHDVSWISYNHKGMGAFYEMVLEDYLAERRYQVLQKKEDDMGSPSQVQSSPPPSTLSKYGHWIRKLPSRTLEDVFRLSALPGINKDPTLHELILHLFKRCSPQMQVEIFSVDLDEDLDSDNPKRMLLDFTLPRLRHLIIQGNFKSPSSGVLNLMNLLGRLDHHAVTLEALSLEVDFSKAGMICIQEDQAGEKPEGWTFLRYLSLRKFTGSTDTDAFLSWLLKRCSSVKGLNISDHTGSAQSLAEGMLAHLPNLDEINFGDDYSGTHYMTDDAMAQLLSGSRNGWKNARFGSKAIFENEAMDALKRHFSTLEMLSLDECDSVTSDQLVQVLSSCSRLHTLSIVYWYQDINLHDSIDAKVFADVDPDTGSLRPWQCERSLKVLQVRIIGIPRPDLKEDTFLEAYPDQTQELHGQVYDRLARLTNLETLQLGDQCSYQQYDCLELSLKSGLDKLSVLIKLKELDVTRVRTRIGAQEVQWMSEHWPGLRAIYGLRDKENAEALRWLQENCANITLR